MRIDKFYRDSFTLTASNLFTGIIGFVFSILLSRNLGAEGLGLYGLIMPVYNLAISVSCDGMITALSKITTIYNDRRDLRNLNRTMSTAMTFTLIWSLFIATVVFTGSSFIGRGIIKDERSIDALRIICPAIVFISLSATLKGFFYGVDRFKVPAFIDIVEKLFRVLFFVIVISLLQVRDVKNSVTAAYIALSIGELTSFILLYLCYRKHKNRNLLQVRATKAQSRIQLLFNVFVISLPLCINGLLTSLIATGSSLLLPRRLVSGGISYDEALMLIGKFVGMALNIVNLPMIIISSMTTVMVPDISLSISRKDYWSAEIRILKVFRAALIVGASTLIINLLIPESLGLLFYKRNDLERMIQFGAACSVIGFIAAPTFGMLNGLGKQRIVLRNSLIISVQGIVLIILLTGISAINIYGYGIMMVITSVTALIMNFHEIKKTCDIRFPFSDTAAIMVIGLISMFIISKINNLIPDSLMVIEAMFTTVAAFGLVYFLYKLISD